MEEQPQEDTIGDFLRSPNVLSKDEYVKLRQSGRLSRKISFPLGIPSGKEAGEQYGRQRT